MPGTFSGVFTRKGEWSADHHHDEKFAGHVHAALLYDPWQTDTVPSITGNRTLPSVTTDEARKQVQYLCASVASLEVVLGSSIELLACYVLRWLAFTCSPRTPFLYSTYYRRLLQTNSSGNIEDLRRLSTRVYYRLRQTVCTLLIVQLKRILQGYQGLPLHQ